MRLTRGRHYTAGAGRPAPAPLVGGGKVIERYYTIKELVEASGFPKNTLYRAIQSGELKAVLPNGSERGMRVSESSFNEWLEQNSSR